MFYKLSFEIWTGSLTTIALSRFHHSSGEDDEVDENTPVGMLATLQSLNLVFQSLGSAIVAWGLRMGWGTRGILIWMVVCGVGLAGALVGIDAGTGGRWRGGRGNMDGGEERYGHWDARLLVLIFALAGVVAGGVELARKVVPREILRGTGERNLGGALNEVGALKAEEEEEDEDEDASLCRIGDKLRRMDALVHIFYELAGTGGAFLSAELNLRLGSNFAVVIVPGGWLVACAIWLGMRDFRNSHRKKSQYEKMTSAGGRRARRPLWSIIKHGKSFLPPRLLASAKYADLRPVTPGVLTFFTTLQHGLHLILSSPKYAWLPVGYSLSLYTHRFLENNLAPTIAKYVYQEPAYYQIIVGGSNLGELLGALLVFILSSKIKSPLPWVRLDALMLLGVWGVVRWRPQVDEETGKVPVVWAWKLAGVLIPISMGWAAGDVSLVAHIQTHLAKKDEVKEAEVVGEVVGRWNEAAIMPKRSTKALDEETIGSLGAVMAGKYHHPVLRQ